jgi:hypothetical protein
MSDHIDTFTITHKEHGKAYCDERQWPEFEAAGWAREAKPEAKESEKGKAGGRK